MRLFKIHGITYDCFIYTTKNRSLILHQNFKLRLKYFLRDFLCLHSMWIYKKFFQLSVVINLNYFHFYPVEFLFHFKCYLFKSRTISLKKDRISLHFALKQTHCKNLIKLFPFRLGIQ